MKKKLPTAKTAYWWLLLEGITQLILGLLLLFSTDITVFLLLQLLGIYWLIRGFILIIQAFSTKEAGKGWLLFGGILGILSGIVVLRYPIFSGILLLEFLVILIAFVGMVQGIIALVMGVKKKSFGEVLLGIVLCTVCLLIFANPTGSLLALLFVIGMIWVLTGTALIITALSIRK